MVTISSRPKGPADVYAYITKMKGSRLALRKEGRVALRELDEMDSWLRFTWLGMLAALDLWRKFTGGRE